jgi:hypothetical protein
MQIKMRFIAIVAYISIFVSMVTLISEAINAGLLASSTHGWLCASMAWTVALVEIKSNEGR